MDRLSVLCFAGTYGLALACDLSRFVVRGRARWVATVALTALGWAVHTAFLGDLARRHRGLPMTTAFESLIVLAWILAAIDLYLVARSPRSAAVGVFVLPVVLGLLIAAGLRARATGARDPWAGGFWVYFWGTVHGVLLLAGAVCTCVAFAAGLMYLAQTRRLKLKRAARRGFALPSLEQSERWNRWAITLAFPLLTAGMVVGLALNVAVRRAGGQVLSWLDPKVVSTGAFWVFFAALLHARFKPEWRGRRVMVLTVLAFAFLAFAMVGVGRILPTAHGLPVQVGRSP